MASSAELIADSSLSRFPIDSHNIPPVLHLTDPSTALHLPIQQEALIPGTNTSADIDFFLSHVSGPVQPHFEPTEYPLIEELYEDGPEDLLDLHEDPADIPVHKDHISAHAGPFHSEPNEDEPDPFVVESNNSMPPMSSIQREPDHLLVIYAIVAWLHMQFSLPHVACNALLMFLACLLMFLVPGIHLPFVTLQSATCTLGIDPRIHLLAVCPNCRDVFPSATSKYMQDECTCYVLILPLLFPLHLILTLPLIPRICPHLPLPLFLSSLMWFLPILLIFFHVLPQNPSA
jgi:hypothetical protein